MKRILLIILLVMVLLVGGCGFEGDPMLDDAYTRNVYPGETDTYDVGSESLVWDNGHFNNVFINGSSLYIPAYGEIYLVASDAVECTVANDWYIVDGATNTGERLGFSNNGNGRLTYMDVTKDRICLINIAMTLSVDAADVPCIIKAQVFKNGMADSASLVGDQFTVGDAVEALPIVCLIELLDANDYIEVYISSNKVDTSVTVHTLTIIATTVD